eukprot:scaffold10678_cov130-Skeletonema_marinoi.AAC.6
MSQELGLNIGITAAAGCVRSKTSGSQCLSGFKAVLIYWTGLEPLSTNCLSKEESQTPNSSMARTYQSNGVAVAVAVGEGVYIWACVKVDFSLR